MSANVLERARRRFTRDPHRGWIAGVCAGAARAMDTDPAFLRVGFIVAALLTPKLAIGAYAIAWILFEESRS